MLPTLSYLYELFVSLQINNAGILGPSKRQVTADGLELTLATNHFGHFLLTNLLLGEIICFFIAIYLLIYFS